MGRGLGAMCVLWAAGSALAATELTPVLKLSAEERFDRAAVAGTLDEAAQLLTKLSPQVGIELTSRRLDTTAGYGADLLLHHGSGSTRIDHRA